MNNKEKLKLIVNNPVLYIETFMRIPNKEGVVVPFKLTPQQKYFIKNMGKYNIVLKSRQIGISSVIMAYVLYLTHTQKNCTCLLMAHSDRTVGEIFKKLKALYDNMYDCVRLQRVTNNRTELSFVNGSQIICCSCGYKDVARGTTLRFAHLSEVALMGDTFEAQLTALKPALAPDSTMVLESTAKGLNHFSEIWNKATSGESPMWKPFFFPWTKDRVMNIQEQKELAELYIATHGKALEEDELTDVEVGLMKDGATIEQIMWRRIKINDMGEQLFAQEYPSNPVEAFVSTGENVFDSGMLLNRLSTLYQTKLLTLPKDIAPILRKYKQYLQVWKLPVKKKRYYIGVDTAEGLGGSSDYSVICVMDAEGFQCAEWRSNKVKPYEFADIVLAMGQWYNDGLLIIERASAGHTVLDKIVHSYKYQNIYKYKEYDQRGKAKRKPGWETSGKSKPIMIADFQEWFETKQCCINSKDLLEEMKLYQAKDGSYNAASGHDDLVIGFALSIQGLKSQQWRYNDW